MSSRSSLMFLSVNGTGEARPLRRRNVGDAVEEPSESIGDDPGPTHQRRHRATLLTRGRRLGQSSGPTPDATDRAATPEWSGDRSCRSPVRPRPVADTRTGWLPSVIA